MPNINRIRVNNVKYNFGTQGYDDFTMRMYGKNTLYDLANGGGKSVLMLLLLQNLIPNCTLDEKQPIEKLFRNGGGNTTIHSLVEWRLDDKDVKEGFRYMTTGFCARKAKDVSDGEDAAGEDAASSATQGESASIDYFNYCIFYKDYNENDIVNLPLQNQKERITYSGLRTYLKELGRRTPALKVYVFERKGEYQRFISRYGLFESQWEIIRGINKTEGHVRTYFETHYKTTRKVVEDLLIEEIIEKAFLVKTEQDNVNEDMAKTLLDIKDKLVELSRKKSEIANYDKETELMRLLEGRVSHFLELYQERDAVAGTLADIYVTGQSFREQGEQEIERMEQERAALNKRLVLERRRMESLKVIRDRYVLQNVREQRDVLEEHAKRAKQELAQAQAELDLKESMNDYLRYIEDKTAMEENQAVLQASSQSESGQLEKLQRYAAARKQMDDESLKDIRTGLEQRRKEVEELSEKAQMLSRVLEEGKVSLAVARSHKEKLQAEYEERMEEIREVRKEVSVLVLSDLKDLTRTLEEEAQTLQEKASDAEKQYREDLQKLQQTQNALYTEQEAEKQETKAVEDANAKYEEYIMNRERLKKMEQIYDVKDAAALYPVIKERAFRQRVEIANLEQKLHACERHLEQVKEGRILEESEAVSRVKDYLETRHGDFALSGVDYLSALPKNNREEVLERFPLLPYGVVTKQFDVVKEDERIATIDLGSYAVPVYDQQILESPYIPEKEEGVLLIAKERDTFTDENALFLEQTRLEQKLAQMQETLERYHELDLAYEEDLDYTAKLTDAAFMNAEQDVQEGRERLLEHQQRIRKLKEEIEQLTAHSQAMQQAMDEAAATLRTNQAEQVKLAGIVAVSDLADETKKQLDRYSAEVTRLEKDTQEVSSQASAAKLAQEEMEAQIAHLEKQEREVLADWDSLYKEYYVEGIKADNLTLTKEQLHAQFLAAKAVYEHATIVLEDKKKLIAALAESMQRGLRVIERRHITIEQLEQLRAEGSLHPVEDAYLNRMSLHLSQLAVQTEQLRGNYRNKETEATRLEGRVEQAVQALKERFGEEGIALLEELSASGQQAISKEEAEQAIVEGDRILKSLAEEQKRFEQHYQQYVKNHNILLELYKDVKRIVESEELDLANANVLLKEQSEIREIFEESLLQYDKSNKALNRARQELLNYKTQTANTFFAMGAFELSDSMKEDVAIPETYAEARELLGSIREMISYIALEKERVQQGIEDMEAVKNHFENQCIERCRDVRTELEKLPKLSRIQLDGEMIQMVDLHIPYVKDEFLKQRMSDYIDEVVNGADQFKDNNERIKYMKGRLLLKRLFSVMVTDMNAIRLKLYKRERMKEQSRYLRYEEAVGSTGQSQGIYIQFLISIINYISGMYAPEAEPNQLKKVIFIDNPFGAAKDIYIWEPIFALLKTNNVQLIVPARGATPAITSRFDVNYILGQQLVGGRQQTVVVDYRSQVAQEEMEYQNLEYSQGTFDFI